MASLEGVKPGDKLTIRHKATHRIVSVRLVTRVMKTRVRDENGDRWWIGYGGHERDGSVQASPYQEGDAIDPVPDW
jgi:hypothetical protein